MIPSPYNFEPKLSDQDLAKIGILALRWSHIDHILGNCLKVLLRLTDEEAVVMVFPLSLEHRLTRIKELSEINPLLAKAPSAFDELAPIMRGLQVVRNNVIHSIVSEKDGKHVFHLRSKMRSFTKAEIFSTEELTNYAAHCVLALRYALGFKDGAPHDYALPDRPEIPEFLRTMIQFPKGK
jgi:hypothetical protein